jgi:hypothetical protein
MFFYIEITVKFKQLTTKYIHGRVETSSRWRDCCQQKQPHGAHTLKSSENRVNIHVIAETLAAPLLGKVGSNVCQIVP